MKLNENDQGLDPFETNLTISSFCNTIYRRNFYDHTLATHTMFKNGFKTLSRNDDVWCREIHAHIMNDLSFEPYELTEYYYRNFNYPVWRKIHDEIKLKEEYD